MVQDTETLEKKQYWKSLLLILNSFFKDVNAALPLKDNVSRNGLERRTQLAPYIRDACRNNIKTQGIDGQGV